MDKYNKLSDRRKERVVVYLPPQIKKRLNKKLRKTPFNSSEVIRAVITWLSILTPYEITELINTYYGVMELGLKKYGKDVLLTKLGEMVENIKAEILWGDKNEADD